MSKKDNKAARQASYPTLTPLSRVMRPIVQRLLPQKMVYFRQLFEAWPDLVHGTEAMGTILEKLVFPPKSQTDGQLHLWAKTSAQATEVTFNQIQLLQRVNSFFGAKLVSTLRVTAFPKPIISTVLYGESNVNVRPDLTSQYLDKSLTQISNDDLRHALAGLAGALAATPDSDANSETTKHSINKGETNA